MRINEELAKIYLDKKLITQQVLDHVMHEIEDKNKRLDTVLLEQHLVTDEGNAMVYADLFNMEYGRVSQYPNDEKVVTRVTQDFVDKYKMIPINVIEGETVVAVANPFDYEGLRKVHSFAEPPFKIIVSSPKEIQGLKNVIFSRTSTKEAISSFTLDDSDRGKSLTEESDLYGIDVQNAPAVRLTDSIVREAIAYGASDIHIEPYENHVRVRYRVDGELHEASTFDTELYPAVLTRVKIISGINIAKKRIPQDGRIKQRVNDNDYDFRVSTLPTAYGERIVIRILDTEAFAFDREQLGFLDVENEKVDFMLRQPHGIILLVGPTGCGKTTTLYSFIRELNQVNTNIVTVEDPIEYTIEGVGQVQVNTQADLTFARALRSILRQDPNVIMLGEIRDEETAQIAVRSAITGHLVFSTLHTNSAPGSVTRLLDMGLQPYFVADAVVGIVAQRLVRRVCLDCRKRMKTKPAEMEVLNLKEPRWIYRADGCPACNYTGYKGRLGVHEIFVMDEDLKELIQMRVSTEQIAKKAKEKGMLTLYDTARHAVLEGLTTIQELSKVVFESANND